MLQAAVTDAGIPTELILNSNYLPWTVNMRIINIVISYIHAAEGKLSACRKKIDTGDMER